MCLRSVYIQWLGQEHGVMSRKEKERMTRHTRLDFRVDGGRRRTPCCLNANDKLTPVPECERYNDIFNTYSEHFDLLSMFVSTCNHMYNAQARVEVGGGGELFVIKMVQAR
jgi:hypothetical protein